MPIKTTIDKNAPILMQWIVSDPSRLKEQAEEEKHPLPNTKVFLHRQRLLDMATVEPDRLICLYYLGDTLNKKQNEQMQELEDLAPNIRAIDFNKLDWSEYDFEFNTSMLSAHDKGEEMNITEYLKLPNTDNHLGFKIDIMRTLMLLKAEQGIIEAGKVKKEEEIGKGAIFFDFDHIIDGRIGELKAPHGILSGYCKGCGNLLDFFFYAIFATAEPKNLTLTRAYECIKNCILKQENAFEASSLRDKENQCILRIIFSNTNRMMFNSVAYSIGDSVIMKASKESQDEIVNCKDVEQKLRLMSNFIKKDEICLTLAAKKNGASILNNPATINDKEFHSWTTSEDLDVNKNLGSATTYTEIFDMMYRAPELEVKNNVSTKLEDVRQENTKKDDRRKIM